MAYHLEDRKDGGFGKTQKMRVFDTIFNYTTQDQLHGIKSAAFPIRLCGIMYMKDDIKKDKLIQRMMEKVIPRVFRMRAIPVERNGGSYFDEVPLESLDLDYHFVDQNESYTDKDAWNAMMISLAKRDFDLTKPFWRFHLFQKALGRPAIVFCVDHVVCDGASLTALLREYFCDGYEGATISKRKQLAPRSRTLFERLTTFASGIMLPLLESVLPGDRQTKLKSPPGVCIDDWELVTSEKALDLKRIKDIKDRIPGSTVNDVMLAVVALGVKKYYEKINEPIMTTKKNLCASFVVDCRPRDADRAATEWLGNEIVISSVAYPLHSPMVETVFRVTNETYALKASPEVPTRMFIRDMLLSKVPRSLFIQAALELNAKFSFTTSNVYMGEKIMTLGGNPIEDIEYAALTPFGGYFGMSTYAGKVRFCCTFAKEVQADGKYLVQAFEDQLNALHDEVLKLSPEELKEIEHAVRTSSSTLNVFSLAVIGVAVGALVAYGTGILVV